jgi:hypothetical protein
VVTEQARWSLASFVVEVHRLATGRAITIAEAREYFNHPESLADVVRRSGLVNDPPRRLRLQQLLAAQQPEESAHGI